MNAAKHTPGPWTIREHPNSGAGVYIEPGIGEVYGAGRIPAANARLIAAAPELLEAMNAALDALSCEGDYEHLSRRSSGEQIDAAHSLLFAAIAKAEGRA